jgi:O-antigen/teichoic acid export membrane protein
VNVAANDPDDPYAGLRNETPTERMDRNWVELLQELRVVQTGVQLLTGFLLTLPFQSRFEQLDRYQLAVYVVVLLFAVTAVVLFIAPVGYHRALFRQRSKDRLVAAGTAFTKAGLATVGVVVSGGVLLVADVIGGRVAGWVAGGAVAALVLVCWYVLPRRVLRQVQAARSEG